MCEKIDVYLNELFTKCENEEQVERLIEEIKNDKDISKEDLDYFMSRVDIVFEEENI